MGDKDLTISEDAPGAYETLLAWRDSAESAERNAFDRHRHMYGRLANKKFDPDYDPEEEKRWDDWAARKEPDFHARWAEYHEEWRDAPKPRPGQSLRDALQKWMGEKAKLMHGDLADVAEYRRLQPWMQLYVEAIVRLDRGESLPDGPQTAPGTP